MCPSRRFGPFAVSPACCLARAAALRAPCCLSCVPSRPRRNASGPSLSLSRGWVYVRSAMWLCTDQSCPPVTNVARNSPPHISDFEIRPLELQRLWAISKNDRVKLRAKLIWRSPRFPPRAPWPGPSQPVLATPVAMGFCTIRSLPSACRRRVAPLMVQFPPFGGGEVTVRGGEVAARGGVAPTAQTTSAKIVDRLLWARWPALRTQRCLAAWSSHANPLSRVLTRNIAR